MVLNDNRLPPRFWSKVRVNEDSGCWEWTASLDECGYGKFGSNGTWKRAHRVAFGHVPNGLELDHLCRVRHCCNPAHLEPVTHKVNMERADWSGNANGKKTQCPRGHDYDNQNTYRDRLGNRHCRTCRRAAGFRYRGRADEKEKSI